MLKPIKMHHKGDCAVCCLAMTLNVPYWQVVKTAEALVPDVRTTGLWDRQIDRVARLLGFKVKRTRTYNIEEDTGILTIDYGKGKSSHAVSLFHGTIIDPEFCLLWEPDVYLAIDRAKPRSLLVIT